MTESERIEEIVSAMLKKPAAERQRWFHAFCGDDSQLMQEVLSRVAHLEATRDPPRDKCNWTGLEEATVETGNLKFVTRLGEGGFGEVWLAFDRKLERNVAVKMLPGGIRGQRDNEIQILDEARRAAQINHPNVVRVLAVGQIASDNTPYIEMEFCGDRNPDSGQPVFGKSLEKAVNLPHRQVAGLMVLACRGVQAAHAHKIIHRDIKPHNIILSPSGEVKVSDFGLAETRNQVRADGPIGTPSYMAPEVARGEPATEQSDIYGLGATLYYLLCGQAPYEGAREEVLGKLRTANAPPAILGSAKVPRALAVICNRAMMVAPEKRYATAAAMADELEAWLRRDMGKRLFSAVVLAAMIGLGIYAVEMSGVARTQHSLREDAERQAKANAATVRLEAGSEALSGGHSFDAMHSFAQAIQAVPESSSEHVTVRRALGLLARQAYRLEAVLPDEKGDRSAAFSPDGTRVLTVSWGNAVRVWRVDTGAVVMELTGSNEHEAISAAFSPDGHRIVTTWSDKRVQVCNADTGATIAEFNGHASSVVCAAFSPDGTRVVSASGDETTWLWWADTGTPIAQLKGHSDSVKSAVFSSDGTRVVTISADQTARVWGAETGHPIAELKGHTSYVWSAAISADGNRVVTASGDGTARVWNADTGNVVVELKGHAKSVWSATFSPDGSRVLTASEDGTARVWNSETGALLCELKGHEDEIHSAAFSSDGTRVVTASEDRTARVWQADNGAPVAELKGHAEAVASASFSADGTRVVTKSSDGSRVWRCDASAFVNLEGHTGEIWSASFSPDGTRVVTGSWDGTAKILRSDTGALVAELRGHTDKIYSSAFSPDGSRVVTASEDGTAIVWRASDGVPVVRLKGHGAKVWSATFSPDGSRVATASEDRTARIWSVANGATIAELKGHRLQVYSAAFSSDGTRIVTASEDRTAIVWWADTGEQIARLKGHEEFITSAAFSPDGSRVVTASEDGTAIVWRADSGGQIAQLKGHKKGLSVAAFSPDGNRVVTTSEDGTAIVWRADTGAPIAQLRGHTGPLFSAAFNVDGSCIITASIDGTARVWDSATGALLAALQGHGGWIRSAAFSDDGKRIITAAFDGTARVWRFDPLPGNASAILIWVEAFSGTELKGEVVQPLSLDQWTQRQKEIRAKSSMSLPADWCQSVNVKTPPRVPDRHVGHTSDTTFGKKRIEQ